MFCDSKSVERWPKPSLIKAKWPQMQFPDRLRSGPFRGFVRPILAGLAAGVFGVGGAAAQSPRPMTVRVRVVQPAVSNSVLAAGRSLWARRGPGRPVRAEIGLATVQVAADRRAVLTIHYYRN